MSSLNTAQEIYSNWMFWRIRQGDPANLRHPAAPRPTPPHTKRRQRDQHKQPGRYFRGDWK
jgi:hypothetical protein